jgi:hypothetical protein
MDQRRPKLLTSLEDLTVPPSLMPPRDLCRKKKLLPVLTWGVYYFIIASVAVSVFLVKYLTPPLEETQLSLQNAIQSVRRAINLFNKGNIYYIYFEILLNRINFLNQVLCHFKQHVLYCPLGTERKVNLNFSSSISIVNLD